MEFEKINVDSPMVKKKPVPLITPGDISTKGTVASS